MDGGLVGGHRLAVQYLSVAVHAVELALIERIGAELGTSKGRLIADLLPAMGPVDHSLCGSVVAVALLDHLK